MNSPDLARFGAHFIVGLASTALSAQESTLLSQLQPIGIILFAHNVERTSPWWPEKLRRLIEEARRATGRSDFLVSIDHEGGKVHRLCPPVTHFPAAWNWESHAEEVGFAMGQELRALGLNLNFAPVLDVFIEPLNQVIGKRALSDDPEEVARWGAAFIMGQEHAGVLACGKHFPGHGATVKDSHFELPVLDISREIIAARELVPFRRAIQQGLAIVMTAHVMYPKLDSSYPATLSRGILGGMLRQELGFKGCVISDAVEMKALSSFSENTFPTLALEAGVDILLVAKPELSPPVLRAIQLAESLRTANRTNLEESTGRVGALLKHVANINRSQGLAPDPYTILGCQQFASLSSELSGVTS